MPMPAPARRGVAMRSGCARRPAMLALVTTDARVTARALQTLVRRVADDTLNCVSVDGDTSPNDSLVALANGAGGETVFEEGTQPFGLLEDAVRDVCDSLAEQLVADAEGAQRYFRVAVSGAADVGQARRAARIGAQSPLVKAALHGGEPNWGRIVAALGRSGATFTLDRCSVGIGGIRVFGRGAPVDA